LTSEIKKILYSRHLDNTLYHKLRFVIMTMREKKRKYEEIILQYLCYFKSRFLGVVDKSVIKKKNFLLYFVFVKDDTFIINV